MAITITVADANKDGTGINFAAYLKSFAKTYSDATGMGDFSGTVTGSYADEDNPLHSAAYVTTDNADGGGKSVIFNGGTGGFAYSGPYEHNGAEHLIYGTLASIVFGDNTKITSLGSDASKYTNSSDITISGFAKTYETTSQDGQILGDILKTDTNGLDSLYNFLSSNSIVFKGSTGSDVFTGYSHADKISGGAGADKLNGAGGADIINGGAGADRLSGAAGADTINGGAGADTILGGAGADKLNGAAGADKINGGAGNDTLHGAAGADRLNGAAGADRIDGDTGNDILTGGAGADTFYFAKNDGVDKITDFEPGKVGKDIIEFAHGLFDSYADVLDHAKDISSGVQITYDGGKLILLDVDVSDLIKADFHLL